MKTLFGIIGALTGAIFGLIAAIALARLLSYGNTLGEGFLFLLAAPLGLLAGIAGGILLGARVLALLRERPNSVARQRRRGLMLTGLLVGVLAAFALVVLLAREAVQPPSDSALLRHFERQQATFEELAKMVSSDRGLQRVDQDWTMPADVKSIGVSPERLAEYRRLLGQAGTSRGFQVLQDHDEIEFLYWVRGSAVTDDTDKGFAYRTTPPPTTVQTLDGIRPKSRDAFVAYRHIRGNWYLFYAFIPD